MPALQWQVEDFSRRSGIECDFVGEGVQDILPDDVKTCAYRVIQEALHNCEKHSGASRVRIRISQAPGALKVDIEDNGCGAELGSTGMPQKRHGSGLLGMRERIAGLGGDVALDSAPGRGLRLSIRIPVSSEGPQPPRAAASAGEDG
jgi:signal transduction histidine kinase